MIKISWKDINEILLRVPSKEGFSPVLKRVYAAMELSMGKDCGCRRMPTPTDMKLGPRRVKASI